MVPADKFALLRSGTDAPPGGWTYLLYFVTYRQDASVCSTAHSLLGEYRQFHAGMMEELFDRVLGMAAGGLDITYDEESGAVLARGEWRGAPITFFLRIVAEQSFSNN